MKKQNLPQHTKQSPFIRKQLSKTLGLCRDYYLHFAKKKMAEQNYF